MSGEWKACETVSRRWRTPCSARRPSAASSAAGTPDSTTSSEAFTAAIDRSAGRSPSRSLIRVSEAVTAAITPRSHRVCIIRPRVATRRNPSSSDSTPAACMAANSPTLWPITAAGTTPQDRQSAVRAHSTA